MSVVDLPRLIIAGTGSGVGKTTVAMAIMAGLKSLGYKVQPFKTGPDYIDPGFHSYACGRVSRNLDCRLLDNNSLLDVLSHAATGADIAVIEGVMGLFDGDHSGRGSTSSLAKLLKTPVILVVDAAGQGQSVAATIQGFTQFEPDIKIAGVILNRLGGAGHFHFIKESLPDSDIILGYLNQDQQLTLAERHLGLIPAAEQTDIKKLINILGLWAIDNLNLEKMSRVAAGARPLKYTPKLFNEHVKKMVKIGVAKDKAFNFYYQDNLDILADLGAEIVYFSPLNDRNLPAGLDGLYLGGGFPEVFAGELSANNSMRDNIATAAGLNMPVYAECGGLIYLTENIMNADNNSMPMCAILPVTSEMSGKLTLGYRQAEALVDNVLMTRGDVIVGHEFHYTNLVGVKTGLNRAYKVLENGNGVKHEGFVADNVLGSFIHLHFASNKIWALRFIEYCKNSDI